MVLHKNVSIKMPIQLYQLVKELAEKQQMSVSGFLCYIISLYLIES